MPRKKIIVDRRSRIVQAADSLFNHYGFEKTTMEDISRESGVPRATIYLEFPTGKEDILMACIERYFGQMLSDMRDTARQSKAGRLETLRQIILHNIMNNYDHSMEFRYAPDNIDRYGRRVRAEMGKFFQERLEFFTDILKQAAMSGEIPVDYDLMRLAEIITHGVRAFMPPFSHRFTREELEREAHAFFSLLLSGAAKQQGLISLGNSEHSTRH